MFDFEALGELMHNVDRFNSPEYIRVVDPKPSEKECVISSDARQVIRAAGVRCYPMEACGLLIGSMKDGGWMIREAREIRNVNTERAADRFQLDPAEFQAVDRELRKKGRDIIGIFHSHPDCPARPSPTDLANAWESYAYIIISILEGRAEDLKCWTLNDAGNKFQAVLLQERPS
jgi:proteasome lid subunit RPN8/RPN11